MFYITPKDFHRCWFARVQDEPNSLTLIASADFRPYNSGTPGYSATHAELTIYGGASLEYVPRLRVGDPRWGEPIRVERAEIVLQRLTRSKEFPGDFIIDLKTVGPEAVTDVEAVSVLKKGLYTIDADANRFLALLEAAPTDHEGLISYPSYRREPERARKLILEYHTGITPI